MRADRRTVSSILAERYGLDARPGIKVICPFCSRATLSIKRDDTLAKCFHPSCGRFIATSNGSSEYESFASFLQTFFEDCHTELLGLGESNGRNAHNYVVKERRIHSQVVADSALGVVPRGYNLDFKLPPTEELSSSCFRKEEIEQATDKLRNCLKGAEGWLCFFYTDAWHHVVAIRFRKPYSKDIRYFKPFKHVAGLFGHGLFSPYGTPNLQRAEEILLVTEGEFNQLQLQSLCVRRAESEGRDPTYLNACAVGGVHNADIETMHKVSMRPVICYDNDKAGFELVERAREVMSVSAFTTPTPDSDLDDFIRSFGDDHASAWNAVKELVTNRKQYHRPFEVISREVFRIRQKQRGKDCRREHEINLEVASIIRDDLLDRGKFYTDGFEGYIFLESEKELIPVDIDSDSLTLLLNRYGLNRSERIFKYIFESLRTESLSKGKQTEVHKLAHYDPSNFVVYLNRGTNQSYRISPESINLVDNGTDGVLFISDCRVQEYEIGELNPENSPLDEIIISKINFADDLLTPSERKIIFLFWLLSFFFPTVMPTKPILAFIGEKGSGKSITARKVGMLILNEHFDVMPLPNEVKDFDAAVTNSPYVAIDNADSKCSWLLDRLAIVATGGLIKRRQLYTTNKLVEIPVKCNLAITSRSPRFRRDDVADRLLIMKVDRFSSFTRERAILAELSVSRDVIMTELIYQLQDVTRALKKYQNSDNSSAFRMADFADFSIKIARYAGIEDEVKVFFNKLSREQSDFALEDDPVFDLLRLWVEKNGGKELTNADLCKELAELAEKERIDFPYTGKTRGFAQLMRNLRPNLAEFFDISEREAGGRKKLFRFTLREKEA